MPPRSRRRIDLQNRGHHEAYYQLTVRKAEEIFQLDWFPWELLGGVSVVVVVLEAPGATDIAAISTAGGTRVYRRTP